MKLNGIERRKDEKENGGRARGGKEWKKQEKTWHSYSKGCHWGFLSHLLRITHPASVSWPSNVLSALSQRSTALPAAEFISPSVPRVGALLTPNSLGDLQRDGRRAAHPALHWAQRQTWWEAGAVHKLKMLAKNNACSQKLGKQSYAAILALETRINFNWSTLSVFTNKCLYGRLKWKISLFFSRFFSFFNEPVKAEIYTLSSLPL